METGLKATADNEIATLLVTHDRNHLPRMNAVHTMIDGKVERTDLDRTDG